MRTVASVAAVATLAAALLPRAALAQSGVTGSHPAASTATSAPGTHTTGPNGPHASPGRLAIYRAQNAYVSHDLDTALSAYREAQGQEHERAEGTLGIGYVMAARNDVEGALTNFREAAQQAVAANDDLTRIRALQAAAITLEGAHRWSDAVTAWQDFVTFATAHPSLGNAANGQARITAIHARDEREAAAAPVRQRIADRQRQNAHATSTAP